MVTDDCDSAGETGMPSSSTTSEVMPWRSAPRKDVQLPNQSNFDFSVLYRQCVRQQISMQPDFAIFCVHEAKEPLGWIRHCDWPDQSRLSDADATQQQLCSHQTNKVPTYMIIVFEERSPRLPVYLHTL